MAHDLDPGSGWAMMAYIGTGVSSFVALLGTIFGARVHTKIGSLEATDKAQEQRIETELRARRESISQLERDMVDAKARMETTLASDKARTDAMLESERAARKELEARLERAMEASEHRVLAAIDQHAIRGEATAKVLFEKQEKVVEALTVMGREFSELKGRLHPLEGKEAK